MSVNAGRQMWADTVNSNFIAVFVGDAFYVDISVCFQAYDCFYCCESTVVDLSIIMLQVLRKNVAGVIWLICVMLGIAVLWRYSQKAGGFGEVAPLWPEQSSLAFVDGVDGGLQLIMFVHPHCPCSRASLGELAVLIRNSRQALSARVLFVSPSQQSQSWVRSGLWQQAELIPNVQLEVDRDGVEAARFGAETSGATLVYSASGQLLFHGGITSARGHYGDNVGRLAIQGLTKGQHTETQTAVFGCALRSDLDEIEALPAM
ncbi:hypothetical protein QEH59_09100 [Coraliomargarita sp. SDUM461004]|uniref:RedB protein n=1 Tax=Thalassobacterium sedimentorum TaxID=3041258 RepID=A0ABU1AII1_9BACT|nr:hypothetical protein [Coraliomargarita sp. SDUM461004]MDQ8194581.1 hypothetical protein [Coraliomargarita sp. SDUM461004]